MKKGFTATAIVLALVGVTEAQNFEKPNVLFIAVDDLRPELGCYGQDHIQSPNIDILAQTGLTFTRAYCNVPVCGASRASILSGLRPTSQRFARASTRQDKDVPGIMGIPLHFKKNGYHTVSLGKIYHLKSDSKDSWSEEPWTPEGNWQGWRAYILPESKEQIDPDSGYGPSFELADGPDQIYPDGMVADEAIRQMQKFKKSDKPFFLAVGFRKPHLPFNAPKKYWDLYDFNEIKLPVNMEKPDNAPDVSVHNSNELRGYTDVPGQGHLDEEFMRKMIHGYYACVSYIDAQVGKVLSELDRLELTDNTIIILWGDHGFHLGEQNMWGKHCNFKNALRAPLILKVPGKAENIKTSALVEFVDVYPTLCDLAGLEKPIHLQGKSFFPLTENPEMQWKTEVYCRWGRGETIITQSHSYTEWFGNKTDQTTARMMYNLIDDPEETVNVSEKPGNKKLVEELSGKLNKHMKERDNQVIR